MAKTKIAKLVLDYTIYPRAHVDDYKVAELREAMRAGSVLPPVIVDRKTLRVVDGFHRIAAAKKEGKASIDVLLKDYASEGELFREAMALNAAHGRGLDKFDKVRSAQIAETLGLSRVSIAAALNMTRESIDGLLLTRVSAEGIPLKRTMEHFAQKTMTDDQRSFNEHRAGGMAPLFYVNQVIAVVESDSVDWENENLVAGLKRLGEILTVKLNEKLSVKV